GSMGSMISLLRGRSHDEDASAEALSVVRVDRRTKSLTKRLGAGEVAVIDHLDIDRVSAEALVACRPAAVLNAAASISGRYPNMGPEILLGAEIPLIDDLGADVMTLTEGSRVRIEEDQVYAADGTLVAEGTRQTEELVATAMEGARAGLSVQLEEFAANTMDDRRRGRQVLIVVRGYSYKEDLAMLRPYVREYRPLLVGVDGGADAILDEGLRPDMIVGDMDSVSDKALTSGAEIVVHAYRDGTAPGLNRVKDLGVEHVVFPATGTSEDIAMLLADEKGASLIVAVGTHETLVEFLDKGRAGMASTFLTRLRVGGKLIDAKGVSRLYRHRISNWQVSVLILAGLAALIAALAATPAGQTFFGLLLARFDDIWSWVGDLFSGLF